jgi:hypothetical protein
MVYRSSRSRRLAGAVKPVSFWKVSTVTVGTAHVRKARQGKVGNPNFPRLVGRLSIVASRFQKF